MSGVLIIESFGSSASFPHGPEGPLPNEIDGDVRMLVGAPGNVGIGDEVGTTLVLVELGNECLGEHTGEALGDEGSRVVGFARFRLGALPASRLVELVVQPHTKQEALDAARHLFAAWGLTTATCSDVPGRILQRLIVPFFNQALQSLDEGLGSAATIDRTIQLGLGHPVGPIERVHAAGLEWHYATALRLYTELGQSAMLPARRARVAHRRRHPANDNV